MCVYRFGSKINGFLSLAYGAGVLVSSEYEHGDHDGHEDEDDVTLSFGQHFEIVYELNHKQRFCYGPVLDIGLEKEGMHYMIGFHIGRIF